MARHLAVLVCAAAGFAQNHAALPGILTFEQQPVAGRPAGWQASPPAHVFADEAIVHGGKRSVRIERAAGSQPAFSGVSLTLPVDFEGKKIELRGFIRTEEVTGFAAFWMREDENGKSVAFDTLQARHIGGTTDWKDYSISIPLHADAQLYFGFLLSGAGKAWADDLQLLVDGKPIQEIRRPQTSLDTDHEFDAGSRVAISELSPAQIENLAALGKVWGFLKYHHPAVAAGQRHWDYDLFRILPTVLKAPDRAAANATLAKWVAGVGDVPACQSCASLAAPDLQIAPEVEWIRSEAALGPALSGALQAVYRNRPSKQFFVSLTPGVGNPIFDREPDYTGIALPDSGFQLLALYRYWNIIRYWYPYRDIMGEDWDKVLAEFIPTIALAKTKEDYQRALVLLAGRLHDSHARVPTPPGVIPPSGSCRLPIVTRFIDGEAVVSENLAGDSPFQRGDVLETLDGKAVRDLVRQWQPYYEASNQAYVLRKIALVLPVGDCGEAKAHVRRDGQPVDVAARRVIPPLSSAVPRDTFRRLSNDVAYLTLSSVKIADAAKYVDGAAGTKGLIIDIRNYPAEFVVFPLGSLLVDKATPFARFTVGDLANPGAFHFTPPLSLPPAGPHYSGKIVILVDELSISQSEYTTMAFRAAPNAVVIGSTTAGADGNVSSIPLPGGLRTTITGIGVFYPDKRPTQRVGIVPDREVKQTVAGLHAGRDEVLEAALREILGRGVSQAEIEKLAHR